MSRFDDNAFTIESDIKDGLSIREYSAIQLRVPDSGDEQIDAMIRKARHADTCAHAISGWLASRESDVLLAKCGGDVHQAMEQVSIAAGMLATDILAALEEGDAT